MNTLTKGKEKIMKECTIGATPLELLLGRPNGLLALRGRDGEDENKDEKSDDDLDDDKSDNDAKSGKDDKDEDGDDKDDKTETVESLKRKLANSEEARNRNADKRKELATEVTNLKAQIAKMEKDGTPDDAIKQQNDDLVKTNASLAETNQKLMLQIAMRDDKAHNWVDPDAALALADLSDVEFDEKTLKPIGLKAALDDLAKKKPFLLKAKDADDDKGRRGGTGRVPGSGSQRNADKASREAALRAKYPGLRR